MDSPVIPAHLLAKADQDFAYADEALGAFLHITTHLAEEHSPALTWVALTTFLNTTADAVVAAANDHTRALHHMIAVAAAACVRLNQHGDYGTDHEQCAPRA